MWPGTHVDPATPYSIPQGKMPKALQISNLDPLLSEEDPDYAPSAIVAAFDHYINQFTKIPLTADSPVLRSAAAQFRQFGVMFTVTTHYPQTAGALMALKGSHLGFDLSSDPHSKTYWEQYHKHTDVIRPSKRIETFTFTIDEVIAMRARLLAKAASDPKQYPTATPGVFWWLAGSSGP
jgi:hypothetical protein